MAGPFAHENMVVLLSLLVREARLPVWRLSAVAHTLLSHSYRAVDALTLRVILTGSLPRCARGEARQDVAYHARLPQAASTGGR